jgi:HlyD family secretion protein
MRPTAASGFKEFYMIRDLLIAVPKAKLGMAIAIVLGTVLLVCDANAQEQADLIQVKNPILKPIKTISIAAGVSGVVDSVLVSEGDMIQVNAVIAEIRADEAKLSVARAKLALELASAKEKRDVDVRLAEKSAQVAEQELARTLKANTLASDTYPANEVDRYRLVAERASIEIERFRLDQALAMIGRKQAEIELQQSQQVLYRHSIRSSVQAMVVSVDKNAGEWVEPSTKMIEVMSLERLRLEAFVDSGDASRFAKGSKASVTIALSKAPETVDAKVTFVSPTANPVNGQVRIFIEFENPKGAFRPGMSVTASIVRDALP